MYNRHESLQVNQTGNRRLCGGMVKINRTMSAKVDGILKSLKTSFDVIPEKARIQYFQIVSDACLRRHDGISNFLRVCQS